MVKGQCVMNTEKPWMLDGNPGRPSPSLPRERRGGERERSDLVLVRAEWWAVKS